MDKHYFITKKKYMYTYIHIVYFLKVAGRAENFRRVKVVSGG